MMYDPTMSKCQLTDDLGSDRELAFQDAATGVTSVAAQRVFDAFGDLKTENNADVGCLFAFRGRPTDEATGMQSNLNRWYDAKVGRWLEEDPLGLEAGDANTGRYCANSPTNGTDRSGLSQLSDALKAQIKDIKNEAVRGLLANLNTDGWEVSNPVEGIVELSKTIRDNEGNATHVAILAQGPIRDAKLLSVDITASGKTINGKLNYSGGTLSGYMVYGDGTTKPKTRVDVDVNTRTGASTVKIDGTLTLKGIGLYFAGGAVVVYPRNGKAPTTVANFNADIKVHVAGGEAQISGGAKYENGGWKANGEMMVVGTFLGASFQVSAGAETNLKTPDYYIKATYEKRF